MKMKGIPPVPPPEKIVTYVIARLDDVSPRSRKFMKHDRAMKLLDINSHGYKALTRNLRIYIQGFKPAAKLSEEEVQKQETVTEIHTLVFEKLEDSTTEAKIQDLIDKETGNS